MGRGSEMPVFDRTPNQNKASQKRFLKGKWEGGGRRICVPILSGKFGRLTNPRKTETEGG